jgi:mRNA-degrading endonuclease RelE of RelBE toxin-antitoxin system
MFTYDISDVLRAKLVKLSRKDKVLASIFYKKVQEITNRDEKTINYYKNLRSPLNEYKRIHLTSNYILLFAVTGKHLVFVDIRHWDDIFGK